ncbi:bifunctional glycosyltransferase family 2/GtrA family protein [Saccharopolyspora dendranthemae]|uniref:dolichyl-phosphate beta-glucosyltransferase n=1 Tax=Saccharopolyspora dendranthemae TaxID=1181886 RepID=A0A561VBI3_9PSEU|nr:bifunctional glycosyltransferase family 2/GtrA family protein [Saccharopolyspora dendranthemae]TWG08983.1 glycosyltransferase involved in cell wall biosynthesis [Saccharopolyspora dendranthemae]
MSAVPQLGAEEVRRASNRTATVDVVVPVYNEERSLPGCLEVLSRYLGEGFPFSWSITVVDNASTDSTLEVAHRLAQEFAHVRVLHLDRKGRGLALRTAWEYSDADVVVYMDVDLSTGLDALLPLVAPLVNGHSDLAAGSRLAPGARTVRGGKREMISRGYNKMIRWTHGARFTDAQCGFKAARTDVIRPLLRQVRDESWFFDTELLLLAEHNGLRVHEVPVDWVEDVDTRVNVVRTATDDVAGLIRVARAKVTDAARVPGLPQRPQPRAAHPRAVLAKRENGLLWQLVSFGAIGLVSTALTSVLYALLRGWWPPLLANLVALTVTTLWNTEANRRYTFLQQHGSSRRVHAQGLIVFALYYVVTSGTLLGLHAYSADPSRWLEVLALVLSSVVGTALRFVLLRSWVFAAPAEGEEAS